MSDPKYSDLILDAIDQLRKRKARPDAERICHILQRRHGLKQSLVNEHLAKLVSEGVVVKVEYKGSTSYRNAAKWVRARNNYYSPFNDPAELNPVSIEAVDALTAPVTDERPYRSVSLQDIEQYLLKRDLKIETLKAKLGKDLNRGDDMTNGELESPENSPDTKKRPKPLNNVGPENAEDSCCDYCLLGVSSNMKGVPEKLLVCRDCGAKAHPSCLDYSDHLTMIFDSTSWVCADCKTCAVCLDPPDDSEFITCDTCDRAYHKICHTPVIESKPKGKWSCSRCVKLDNKNCVVTNECINIDSCDSFASDIETAIDSEFISKRCLDDYPSVVPLADDWTTKEVEMFFRFIGYHSEAPAFREQEIDGQSLLLMKRDDVLTGLSIKLGPALKIYDHIRRLQAVQPIIKKEEDEIE